MRHSWILLTSMLAAGCATQRPVAVPSSEPSAAPSVVVATAAPTKIVETRYEVRGYREPANPDVRHEAHTLHRSTRVPVVANDELETVPRNMFPPASLSPLPASEELAAELATQKAITTEIRSMQAAMAETERQMQAQYALLLRQSAEILKIREQQETGRGHTAVADPTSGALGSSKVNDADVKW